ncbi:wax ester/triacylglycerol synthase family O-acyltransferase [Pseudohalioglobus sediminis]|uniref:diacylglycerol O-acyltransferase n=1 Tax=Pseudohalioglobus sediminis TaxID=2606449 RepID=A0A5B0WRD7_9GAMM|nr:wax ester/triacylglycerol synthase family O-acyltransferase [Pseudohalioglobus sediminis]KAA1189018.1 wax ester/triacylglycerol synthase family O-acyltransferase [Pseudohalioglobus sediminis]
MEQLTEIDNTFVQMESNRTPMHITPVMFYDQSQAPGGRVRFKDILEVFSKNLHKSKVFRRKLAGGALGFDTPYWIEDADFDLEFHVRHIALPKPGDWRQLCILMARLHARGLDMRRPLWEAYVIEGLNEVEGLPPNSFAIMIKIHHAAIDGVSGAEIITAIHSMAPDDPLPDVDDDWQGEVQPPLGKVVTQAYINNVKRPLRLVSTVSELVPNLIKANRLTEAHHEGEEEASTSKTRFNGRVSSHRVTDTLVMELARIKKIRQHVPGSTINDVIVTVVSGAMRKYLLAKDELPEHSLTCAAPINVRRERNSGSKGNEVGMMTIDMATDREDPLLRLQAVLKHSQNSKETSQVIGTGVMMDVTRSLWPQFAKLTMRAATFAAERDAVPMPIHTVISNVPGPQQPLYLAGARLHMLMGLGPLVDMAGLFHAVISGMGLISINFLSCREMMPDPDFYKQCLEESYDELEKATFRKAKPRKRRAKRA